MKPAPLVCTSFLNTKMYVEALSPVEFPRIAVSSLKAGNVMTTRGSFTVILVGETGTGKTSFLSLLVNVLAGKTPSSYNLEPYDVTNEYGGPQKHSQTKAAKVYKFTSLNGVDITVLDTPGLADTRGLEKDNEHKESITTAIGENIPEVTAVIILANGTNPRLGVATDYTITTLSSIFPRTLAENIGILFTNVSNPLSWNFELDTLPDELRRAKSFLIDNPLGMQKKYLKDCGKLDQNKIKKFKNLVNQNHQTAVETLAEIFDWFDGLESQATTEITSLYNKSIEIEHKIDGTLASMTQCAEKVDALKKLVKDSNGTELTDSGAANFKLVIQRRIWETQISVTQNTVCHFPLCYTNCHEECSGGFTLGRWKLIECRRLANNRGICKECRHPITYHQHDKVAWCEKVEEKNCIDNETATVSIAQVLETIETYKKEIEEGTVGIGRLAEQYSELSLSGSFSGQVGKSVTLFETHLENMRNKSDPESVKRIEESLNQLKNKLRLLQDAAKAAHKKVYRPTIAD